MTAPDDKIPPTARTGTVPAPRSVENERLTHARGTPQSFRCGAEVGRLDLDGNPTCPRCKEAAPPVDEADDMEAFTAAYECEAKAIEALVAEDDTGGGMILCHLREAADSVRNADIDDALLSLDAIEVEIQQIREHLKKLQNGEIPR